ncbi:MAG: hypothetical protein HY791_26175 [Deltaproteobacteria bacterium]|nr:hypothetical protein [Deltaproteobacteria bacterium]
MPSFSGGAWKFVFGLTFCAALADSEIARGQTIGTDWLDQNRGNMASADGPTLSRSARASFRAGAEYAFTDNVFLNATAQSDSSLVGWAQGSFELATSTIDFMTAAMANYSAYLNARASSSDEERALLRVGVAGPSFSLQLSDVVRREVDPVDVVFVNVARRVANDFMPRASVNLHPFKLELTSSIQVVVFTDDFFGTERNNFNHRSQLLLAVEVLPFFEVTADASILGFQYFGDTPDADGFALRAGVRGALGRNLVLSASVGGVALESDPEPITGEPGNAAKLGFEGRARYEPTSDLTLTLDVGQRTTFGAGDSSFATATQTLLLAEYRATPDVTLGFRSQVDRLEPEQDASRYYVSLSASARIALSQAITVDLRPSFRTSSVEVVTGAGAYQNFLLRVGLIFSV